MKQLSGLDAVFLHLETPQMPMHVGALHLFERAPGTRGRFAAALRRHVASRLPIAPPLRRRLVPMPLNLANPAWEPAVPDLAWHVVEHRLPAGSGLAELEALVGRLHPVLLCWTPRPSRATWPSPRGRRGASGSARHSCWAAC
ncbi:wax ester/triacylglycerol synthase domain-containing protein [Piscinibacter sakaiensis]|uniref:wax ester/triacylglycerol synthase domain-containing protein n=1 Tax=Piscinibacter sakaiensis TaxID=1547922 RepID=UPI003728ECB0